MIQSPPAAPVAAARQTRSGSASLAIIHSGRRSVVSRAFAASPVRLLTPANHGHAAWVYTSSFGGGLVDGDRTSLDVEVGPAAAAFVSTQASTKVYRSPRGTGAEVTARVAAGGLLVLAPDPVVCFAGARYRQSQQIDLDPGAALVLLDWMTSGRHDAGERWQFDEYSSRISLRVGGRVVVYDALALRAADGELAGRLGRFEVLAVVVLAGASLAAVAEPLAARVAQLPAAWRADQILIAAPVGDAAWVLRCAGRSVEQVGRTLREALGFVPRLLGDDPWGRRW